MWFSMIFFFFFFFKQKTAYEMRISDWSSDVCSSDLEGPGREPLDMARDLDRVAAAAEEEAERGAVEREQQRDQYPGHAEVDRHRSEEHTSELQSLMRISYAVFCLKKKKNNISPNHSKPSTSTINSK